MYTCRSISIMRGANVSWWRRLKFHSNTDYPNTRNQVSQEVTELNMREFAYIHLKFLKIRKVISGYLSLQESYIEISKDLREMYGIRAFGYSRRCGNRISSQVGVIVNLNALAMNDLALGYVSPRIRVISHRRDLQISKRIMKYADLCILIFDLDL